MNNGGTFQGSGDNVFPLYPGPIDPPGGGGDDGGMQEIIARLDKLEARADTAATKLASIDVSIAKIEARLDEFTRHYATKSDLAGMKVSIILWVVSAIFLAQLLPTLLKKLGM
jgi:hypothetical protein